MKMTLLSLVALILMTVVGHAQQVGDSEQTVRKALGKPPLSRASGDRQTWIYSNGTKVIFKGGVVVEAKISGAKAPAPAEETAVAEEAPQVTPPKPSVSRVAFPAQSIPQPIPTKAAKDHRSGFGLVLAVVAYALMFVCGIIIVVEAFRNSVFWGIALLIIPFAQIVFVITHWADNKKPFLISWLVGFPLLVASMIV